MFLTYKIALKAFSVCGLFYPIIFSLFYRAIDFIFNRCFEPFCYFLISFIFHFCTFSFFPFSIISYFFLFFPIFSYFFYFLILFYSSNFRWKLLDDGNCQIPKRAHGKIICFIQFFRKNCKIFQGSRFRWQRRSLDTWMFLHFTEIREFFAWRKLKWQY